MGRPATKPAELRDGYYIEIRNRNSNSGVKIRRDNSDQMYRAAKEYERSKEVIILGKYKNGKLVESLEKV
ncbi:hypothetical protein GCM10007962_21960 [Yeosuana aromativorans]|jgi:hypothetical protein|uniref:Uncharacterized protein n=1 Tax=Yeosuana aromativorans TaxID=288019 RepID=A0A8J3FJ09_9FLAO|nr:hypothetical protein [Yeosuana aromativorans]GGK27344.1 hypothetical protein GCM10007962_21960 [Yeosuana aromativorans]